MLILTPLAGAVLFHQHQHVPPRENFKNVNRAQICLLICVLLNCVHSLSLRKGNTALSLVFIFINSQVLHKQ